MKRIIFPLLIVALVLALAVPAGPVKAQIAAKQTWTSSIYYYNPTDQSGNLVVVYWDQGGTQAGNTSLDPQIAVGPYGSGEVYIGEVNVGTTFKGSAVLSSNVPLVAVYEQAPNANPDYARLLYSAFDILQSKSLIYLPSISNDVKGYISQVGIQNTYPSDAISVKVTIYKPDGTVLGTVPSTGTTSVPINASTIFQANTANQSGLPAFKDYSAVVEVTTTGGTAVAAVEDIQNTGRRAYAYEGVTDIGGTVFMPNMQCKNSHGSQTTTYSVQNTTGSSTKVTVYAYSDAGVQLNKTPFSVTIPAHGKATVDSCKLGGTLYKSGWAKMVSDSGDIAVVGKTAGGDGLATAFTGKTAGNSTVVLPYLLWAGNIAKGYRSTISIVNVSGAANQVSAIFHRNDGKAIEVTPTINIAKDARAILDPAKASAKPFTNAKVLRPDGNYRGALEINSAGPVVVIVRMERKVSGVSGITYFGEDYTGLPYIPAP